MADKHQIITRSRAKDLGLQTYFTGKPCKNSHISLRYTSKGMCVACCKEQSNNWIRTNTEKNRKKSSRDYHRRKIYISIKRQEKRNAVPLEERRELYKQQYCGRKTEHIQSVLKWKQNNPIKAKIIRQKHRSLKLNAPGSFDQTDLDRILKEQDGFCVGCGKDIFVSYTIDHIIALSIGGTNHANNIQLLCRSCNSSKGVKNMLIWLMIKSK